MSTTYTPSLQILPYPRDPKSFAAFLDSDEGRKHCTLELHQRLAPAAAAITRYNQLAKFVKERFPSEYGSDWRTTTVMRENLRLLWAAYLRWAEQGSAP